MPDKFRDRCVEACESVFLLSPSATYQFNSRAIADQNADGKDCPPKNYWAILAKPHPGHHAAMPPALAQRCVMAASAPGDLVIDPFTGSGTTGVAAVGMGRRFAGAELNAASARYAQDRIDGGPLFSMRRGTK